MKIKCKFLFQTNPIKLPKIPEKVVRKKTHLGRKNIFCEEKLMLPKSQVFVFSHFREIVKSSNQIFFPSYILVTFFG